MITVAIDAGHGFSTPGKRCLKSLDPFETREWTLNNSISIRLSEILLLDLNCAFLRVDDITGITDHNLSSRVSLANRKKADYFISIHHDAGINGGTGGGITVFTRQLSSEAEMELAQAVYDEVIKCTGLKGNRTEPLRRENYTVLTQTKMPAILIECGFMDSATDVPIILTDYHAKKCAEGIAAGIAKAAKLEIIDINKQEPDVDTSDTAAPSDWARDAWTWAKDVGITDGTNPREPITREQAITMLSRFSKMYRL